MASVSLRIFAPYSVTGILDRIEAAQCSIAEHGEIFTDQYNKPRLNPAVGLEKTARDGFFAAMRMLDISDAPEPDRYGGYRR